MKIIEAMKEIKRNEEKILDLQHKIGTNAARLSIETSEYGDQTEKKVSEWVQSCEDLTKRNVELLIGIQHTNLETSVTIELGGKSVTKSIAEWVWRRRKYANLDRTTWQQLSDKGLRDGRTQTDNGGIIEVSVVRNYDTEIRDARLAMYREEPGLIDSTLEVVNATTDVVGLD